MLEDKLSEEARGYFDRGEYSQLISILVEGSFDQGYIELLTIQYMITQGKFVQAYDRISQFFELERTYDPVFKSQFLVEKAKIYLYQGEYEKSLSTTQDIHYTLQMYQKDKEILVQAKIYEIQASNYEKTTKLHEARESYSKALNMFESKENLLGMARVIRGLGNVFWYKGEIELCISYYNQSLSLLTELENEFEKAITSLEIAKTFVSTGRFREGFNTLQEPKAVFENFGNTQYVGRVLNLFGLICLTEGDIDKAEEHFSQSLDLRLEIGNQRDIAMSYNNLGLVSWNRGDLPVAIDFHEKSLEINLKIMNKKDLSNSYNNIGIIRLDQGQIDEGLEYLFQVLEIEKELGVQNKVAVCLTNIGRAYLLRGDYDDSLSYFIKAYHILQIYKNEYNLIHVIFQIIQVYLKHNQTYEIEKYQSELIELVNANPSKINQLVLSFTNALILKNKANVQDLIEAQRIFEKIMNQEVLKYTITISSMINFVEIALTEYSILGDEETLNTTSNLLEEIYKLTQEKKSYYLMIKTLILKIKLGIIRGDFDKLDIIFEQAISYAITKGLNSLLEEITKERENLIVNLEKWKRIINTESSLDNIIRETDIIGYLRSISNYLQ